MIDLYSWPTPNGHKVHIMLEETGLAYNVHPINIQAGDQFGDHFLSISPNNRIPAMIDQDGPGGKPYSIFESGAILIYLADKTGQFLPTEPVKKYDTLQWLMWQMGGVGPMFGQAHHFRGYAPEKIQYGIDRYTNEAGRLYRIMDKQLGKHEYLAGSDYTIADMATFPWTRSIDRQGHSLKDFPNVKRWSDTLNARPALAKGVTILEDVRGERKPLTDEQRAIMFGDKQFEKR
ncbi:MAG: glutathione binding-like protein [Rhodospirillaceae bacterium]